MCLACRLIKQARNKNRDSPSLPTSTFLVLSQVCNSCYSEWRGPDSLPESGLWLHKPRPRNQVTLLVLVSPLTFDEIALALLYSLRQPATHNPEAGGCRGKSHWEVGSRQQ